MLVVHSQTTCIVFCLKYACPIHVDPFALKYPPPPLLNVLLKANPRNMMEPESYFIYRRKVMIIRKFFARVACLPIIDAYSLKLNQPRIYPFMILPFSKMKIERAISEGTSISSDRNVREL